MSNNFEEDVTTQTGTSDAPAENAAEKHGNVDSKIDNSRLPIQRIQTCLAECASVMAYRSQDSSIVRDLMKDIFATTCQLNQLTEFVEWFKVNGETVYVREYRSPSFWNKLVVPSRILASDTLSAFNFKSYKSYSGCEGKVLDPESYALAWKKVCTNVRANLSFEAITTEPVMLLNEATKFAVTGNRVVDVKQDTILFLTQAFDREAVVSVDRWAKSFIERLFT